MERAQAMTWIVIIVMVASSLGFAVVASQGNAPVQPAGPPPLENPTVLNFSAEGVEGEVVEVFSSMVIAGSTTEAEIGKIDAELYAIPGVARLSSRYNYATATELAAGLVYRADIYLKPNYTAKDVFNSISENSALLAGVDAGVYGLVALQKSVTFTNPQLEITREHVFGDPLVQAYLSIDSVKGDNVIVSLDAQFSGEQMLDLVSFETYNVTASPKQQIAIAPFIIASLEQKLRVISDVNYSYLPGKDALRAELAAIPGVEGIELETSGPSPTTYLYFDGNISGSRHDLNLALLGIEGVEAVRFYTTSDAAGAEIHAANVDFGLSADFIRLKQDIEDAALSLGAGLSIKDPRVSILADLNTAGTDTLAISESAKALLEAKRTNSAGVFQPASFDADYLMPADGNSYEVPGGGFPGFVQPGHSAGDEVLLEITFMSTRGIADSISAIEPTKSA